MGAKKKFFVDTGYAFITFSFLTFIRFLRKPILARFLGPEGMGLFAMVTMIIGVIEKFASFGIPAALIKFVAESKNDDLKNKLIVTSAHTFLFLIGCLAAVIIIILADEIAMLFKMADLSFYLKIYAFAIPFSFLYSINLAFFNGKREMKLYSYYEIIKSTLNFILVLTMLYLGYELTGVLIGSIIALLVTLSFSSRNVYKQIYLNFRCFYDNIKRLISFGIKLMSIDIVAFLSEEINILIIGFFLLAQDVGYYSVAISLTHFIWIIPDSIQKVLFPTTAEYWSNYQHENLNTMFDKSIKLSTIFMLVIGITILSYTEILVQLLFGSDFLEAVLPLQILIVGAIVYGSLNRPIGNAIAAAGLVNLEIYKVSISALINIMLNLTLVPVYGITGGAIATSFSLTISAILNMYILVKYLNFKVDSRWFISILIITLFFGIIYVASNLTLLSKSVILLLYYGALTVLVPKKEAELIWNEVKSRAKIVLKKK